MEQPVADEETATQPEAEVQATTAIPSRTRKKTIKGFMDTFKNNLIEMFKEEEDAKF
jgi:hypothetical protein